MRREESRSGKEKVAESDMRRKLELSGMRKSAESDTRESQNLYKNQNSDTKEERDKEGGELGRDSKRVWRVGLKVGRDYWIQRELPLGIRLVQVDTAGMTSQF